MERSPVGRGLPGQRADAAGHVDDPRRRRAAQQRQHRVGDPDDADDVGLHHRPHLLGGDLGRVLRHAAGDAGVVDQHVEPPGVLLDRARRRRRRWRRRSRPAVRRTRRRPSARSFSTAASRRLSSRAPTPTLQPRAPRPAAISYPIPLLAPVTSAMSSLVCCLLSHASIVRRPVGASTNTDRVARRYRAGISPGHGGSVYRGRRGDPRAALLRRRRRGAALRPRRRAARAWPSRRCRGRSSSSNGASASPCWSAPSRGVTLTEAGSVLLREGRAALDAVDGRRATHPPGRGGDGGAAAGPGHQGRRVGRAAGQAARRVRRRAGRRRGRGAAVRPGRAGTAAARRPGRRGAAAPAVRLDAPGSTSRS